MQQNSDPTAPPMEVDDFSWIAQEFNNTTKSEENANGQNDDSKNNNNNNNDNDNEEPSNDVSKQQQMVYEQILAEQRMKKNKSFEEQKQYQLVPDLPNNNNNNNNNDPQSCYINGFLRNPECQSYKNAGLCVWRQKANGNGIQFMMGLEKTNNTISWFGGKRDYNDKTPADTALREFHEETEKQLDDTTLAQIRRMLLEDKDRKVFWKKEWFSALYFYQMSYDYGIVDKYQANKGWNAEMKKVWWVDFDMVYRSVCINGQPLRMKKQNYMLRSFVVGMLLHSEVRDYLLQLHVQNGGNLLKLQPKKGGALRGTLKSFETVPKTIRLDMIHPITHNILFHRWVEMNVLDISDYQLLMSLIGSLFPELNNSSNFILYYCNNGKCGYNVDFKKSNSQMAVDTVPAFTKLQNAISAMKKQFVTVLSILPTFIISDDFKDVPLTFKSSQVSWKTISSNDDEKNAGLVSKLYNAASEMAFAWFANDDDSSDDDVFGESGYRWKWQYQNDQNTFTDFTSNNSRLIEKAFVSGCSFAGFKRKKTSYQANFITMVQKNLNTNKIRSIRRVLPSVKSDENEKKQQHFQSSYHIPAIQYYKWQYQENDGTWKDYDISISKQLNSFKGSWDRNFNNYHYTYYRSKKRFDSHYTKEVTIQHNNFSYNYLIDIKHFKQQNKSTKKERKVRQVPVYNYNANNSGLYYGGYGNNSYNNNNNSNKNKNLNNNGHYKWQYRDDGYNNWTDYDVSSSKYIEKQWTNNNYSHFILNCNGGKQYRITLGNKEQKALISNKVRKMRRIPLSNKVAKNRWEWQDDDNSWKKYDKQTSVQIENARNNGIKKYFFVSNKNNQSYEINFNTLSQYNVQSGKQRMVRPIGLKAQFKGKGYSDPKAWKGPLSPSRKTFGDKVMNLYCVVGSEDADEIKKCGKFVRGTLGPFGAGLYFTNSDIACKKLAESRHFKNRGFLVNVKVFVGKENDVSNMDDKQFDFYSLQKSSFDSISRYTGMAKEFIVYNSDQICIVKVEKYQQY